MKFRALLTSFIILLSCIVIFADNELPINDNNVYGFDGIKSSGDSLNTTLLGGWFNGTTESVYLLDTIAYVSVGGNLDIFNIADPTNIQLISKIKLPAYIFDVYVQSDILYAAVGNDGVCAVDVSDVSNPLICSIVNGINYVYSVHAIDTLVYVAEGADGIEIFNYSNPYAPISIGSYNTPTYARSVHVIDTVAFRWSINAECFQCFFDIRDWIN